MGDYNIDYKTFALTGRIIGVYVLPRASPHFVQLALGYVLTGLSARSLTNIAKTVATWMMLITSH
ncbi:MAG: hypothetical protein IKT92_02350 [Bacteroidaceae bacterium]|nr:hypothetical protein [Bacteroidaceae bacterium]